MGKSGRSGPILPDMLPPLTGWGLRAYNLFWAATLMLAVAMSGVGAWKGFAPMQYGWLNYGLSSDPTNREVALVTGAEARTKGISSGDRILAIDGIPVEQVGDKWDAFRNALARPEGGSVALTLRDARGQVSTHRLTSSAANTLVFERSRGLQAGATLLMQLALMVGAILLFRRRREPVPALLALSFTILAAGASADANLWLDQPLIDNLVSASSFALMLFGLLMFPDGRMASRGAWAIAAAIIVWAVAPFTVPRQVAEMIFGAGGAVLLGTVGVRQILRYRGMAPGNERQQVRWATLGFASGIFFFIVSMLSSFGAYRSGGMNFELFIVGSTLASLLGVTCIVGGLLVSLMRYRLYDADAVIGRSAAFGVLTLSFVALFAAGERAIEALGRSYLDNEIGDIGGGLAAAGAAALIVPLHRRVHDWAERRFQKQLLRLRRGLPQLVGDLRETASLERIADAVAEAATRGVRASRAAVVVGDALVAMHGVAPDAVGDWMRGRDIAADPQDAARRDPIFPMRLPLETEATGRVGWLLLGPRPDGSFHGKDERQVLAEIAGPVARAIEIARTRARREDELLARIQRLEAIVAGRSGNARSATA